MKVPLEVDRINNGPGGEKTCASCGDEGQLVVNQRLDPRGYGEFSGPFEETGPCPFCVKGLWIEFPSRNPKTYEKNPNAYGAWGPEGYWRGRDVPVELLRHHSDNAPMSLDDNLMRLRALRKSIFGALPEIPSGETQVPVPADDTYVGYEP